MDHKREQHQKLMEAETKLTKIKNIIHGILADNYQMTPASKSNFSNVTLKNIDKLVEQLDTVKGLVERDMLLLQIQLKCRCK